VKKKNTACSMFLDASLLVEGLKFLEDPELIRSSVFHKLHFHVVEGLKILVDKGIVPS